MFRLEQGSILCPLLRGGTCKATPSQGGRCGKREGGTWQPHLSQEPKVSTDGDGLSGLRVPSRGCDENSTHRCGLPPKLTLPQSHREENTNKSTPRDLPQTKPHPQEQLESASPTRGQASDPPIRKPKASPHTNFSHKGGRHQR